MKLKQLRFIGFCFAICSLIVLTLTNIACSASTTSNSVLSSITIAPSAPFSLPVGSIQQFVAGGNYSNDSYGGDITSQVTWISSNTSVATVSSSGLATSVAAGQTSITATLSGITSTPVILLVEAFPTTTATTSTTTPSTTSTTTANSEQWTSPPAMNIDQNKQYTADINTNYGDIVIQLLPKNAPLAVNNFVFLAQQGFYNGVKFHRVVKGFMIQSGDPTGTGMGGPGYEFADELPTTLDYTTGILAMANSGPNTNGSQFFIMLADYSGKLPKNYTIFGKVVTGQDVVDKIGNVPVQMSASGEDSSPTLDVHINTVTITQQ